MISQAEEPAPHAHGGYLNSPTKLGLLRRHPLLEVVVGDPSFLFDFFCENVAAHAHLRRAP